MSASGGTFPLNRLAGKNAGRSAMPDAPQGTALVEAPDPDLARADLSIAPMQRFAGMKGPRRKGAAQWHPTDLRFFMRQKTENEICNG